MVKCKKTANKIKGGNIALSEEEGPLDPAIHSLMTPSEKKKHIEDMKNKQKRILEEIDSAENIRKENEAKLKELRAKKQVDRKLDNEKAQDDMTANAEATKVVGSFMQNTWNAVKDLFTGSTIVASGTHTIAADAGKTMKTLGSGTYKFSKLLGKFAEPFLKLLCAILLILFVCGMIYILIWGMFNTPDDSGEDDSSDSRKSREIKVDIYNMMSFGDIQTKVRSLASDIRKPLRRDVQGDGFLAPFNSLYEKGLNMFRSNQAMMSLVNLMNPEDKNSTPRLSENNRPNNINIIDKQWYKNGTITTNDSKNNINIMKPLPIEWELPVVYDNEDYSKIPPSIRQIEKGGMTMEEKKKLKFEWIMSSGKHTLSCQPKYENTGNGPKMFSDIGNVCELD